MWISWMEVFDQLDPGENTRRILLSSVGFCKMDSTPDSLPWATRRGLRLAALTVDRSQSTLGRIHSIPQAWRR